MREKPWYRTARNAWYVQMDGRQVRLAIGPKAETERAAWAEYHRVMAELGRVPGKPAAPPALDTFGLIEAFAAHAGQGRIKPISLAWYIRHLQPFGDALGDRPAAEIKPIEVARWLETLPTGNSTRNGTVRAIKRAFNWARKQGLIDGDPLQGLERPKMGRRSPAMFPAEADRLIAAVKYPDYRDVLVALRETGARPSEVAAVTAAHYHPEAGAWIFQDHKTDGTTGRPRIVYLNAAMRAMTDRLARIRPAGPLFLNRRGNAWNRNSIGLAFGRLRDRLGLDPRYTPYSLRKSFGTDALARGVPVAMVAELMGHRSTAMLERHYSHLSERSGTLREAAERARAPQPADRPGTGGETPEPERPPSRAQPQPRRASGPGRPPRRPAG